MASGYNIFTPTFKSVATSESFDLTDILPLHQDGDEFGTSGARRCNGVITINKISTAGNYTTSYSFYTMPAKSGWYAGDTKIEGDAVTFAAGEAFLINNQYKGQPVLISLPKPISE